MLACVQRIRYQPVNGPILNMSWRNYMGHAYLNREFSARPRLGTSKPPVALRNRGFPGSSRFPSIRTGMQRGKPFEPGNKIGHGRAKGSKNHATLEREALLNQFAPAIMK